MKEDCSFMFIKWFANSLKPFCEDCENSKSCDLLGFILKLCRQIEREK